MKTKEPLKVGIVGCGKIAQKRHIPSLLKIKNAEVVAACDKNGDLAGRVARGFHISKYYTDLSEMLKKEKVDMVDLCTPPTTHATLSIQAMEMGCHVLVEKPMALILKEADEMVNASEKNQVKLCVVHNMLFEPVVIKARRMISEGGIGDLTGIEVKDSWPKAAAVIANKDHWHHKLPGGVFGEMLAHPIYLASAFLGNLEPLAVRSRKLSSHDWMVADELRVILEGERGLGTITESCNWAKDRMLLDIFGTKMNLRVDLSHSLIIPYAIGKYTHYGLVLENLGQSSKLIAGTASAVLNRILIRHPSSHYTLIRSFIESIKNDTEPPVTAEEGREVVRVWEKITAQI